MGPKNHSIEKEHHLIKTSIFGVQFLWLFPGCSCPSQAAGFRASRCLEAFDLWSSTLLETWTCTTGGWWCCCWVVVGNFKYFVNVHPAKLGKMISILTSIFFRWVGSTTNQLLMNSFDVGGGFDTCLGSFFKAPGCHVGRQGLAWCEDVDFIHVPFFLRGCLVFMTQSKYSQSHDILLVLANLDVLKFANVPRPRKYPIEWHWWFKSICSELDLHFLKIFLDA